MLTVYISIGNSDDKLPQAHWATYAAEVQSAVRRAASQFHGEWASLPFSGYQNACFCIEVHPDRAKLLRVKLANLAEDYKQDSIAWAVAETEFIGPAS